MISKSVLAMLALTLWLCVGISVAEEGALPRKGPWPIRDGHNRQPTERDLKDINRQDVTPDEAREVDRLYDELMADDEKVRKRESSTKR